MPALTGVRRFEVFTERAGARGEPARKAAIIAESYAGMESVCAVANRHGLRHTRLFTWRCEMRRATEAAGTLQVAVAPELEPEPLFVPAVIGPEPITATQPALDRKAERPSEHLAGFAGLL